MKRNIKGKVGRWLKKKVNNKARMRRIDKEIFKKQTNQERKTEDNVKRNVLISFVYIQQTEKIDFKQTRYLNEESLQENGSEPDN